MGFTEWNIFLFRAKPWIRVSGQLGLGGDRGLGNGSTIEIPLGGRTVKNPRGGGTLLCGRPQGWSTYHVVLEGIAKDKTNWEEVTRYSYGSNPDYGAHNSLVINSTNNIAYTRLRWYGIGQHGCTMRNCYLTSWEEQQ